MGGWKNGSNKGKERAIIEEEDEEEETLAQRGTRLGQAAAANARSTVTSDTMTDPLASMSAAVTAPAKVDNALRQQSKWDSYLPTGKAPLRNCLEDATWLRKHTALNPEYLAQYFAQSRLHFLSQSKAELMLLCNELQAGRTPPPRKASLDGSANDGRTILHIDFDCYFVSAGLVSRPELRGKPVAVCHYSTGAGGDSRHSTSEISSCSYEARAQGVRASMSIGRAKELCPTLETIPFEFELYQKLTQIFYAILLNHADYLQAVSVDEILMDVSSKFPMTNKDYSQILPFAHQLRSEIFIATGCAASIGVGHNVLVAKLATKAAKPDSAFHLLPSEAMNYIAPLEVRDLPGIGSSLEDKLNSQLGITIVGDLLNHRESEIARVIGEVNAKKYIGYARGIDVRPLEVGKARQSVSVEVNYGIRFNEMIDVDVRSSPSPTSCTDDQEQRFTMILGTELSERLSALGLQTRFLTLKLKIRHPDAPIDAPKFLGHGYCTDSNKSVSISSTVDPTVLGLTAFKLAKTIMEGGSIPANELRGFGLMAGKLDKNGIPVAPVVRERGQGELNFTFAAPKRLVVVEEPQQRIVRQRLVSPIIEEEVEETEFELPPPQQPRTLECITLLSDSDGDGQSEIKAVVTTRTTRSNSKPTAKIERGIKKRVAPVFRVAQKNGIANVLNLFKRIEADDQVKITKPFLLPKSKIPMVPTKLPNASPSTITDEELIGMKFDVSAFRSIPQELQREEILRKASLTVKSVKAQITATEQEARIVNIKIIVVPKLGGKSSIEDLRNLLESWIVGYKGSEPDEKDKQDWTTYLVKCCDISLGQDFAKVSALLQWWQYLVKSEYGPEELSSGVGEMWWDSFRSVKDRLETITFDGARVF